ncbi:MAG: N-glycosylase/DNA lyase [Candidatus Woesearchaeota archaeon]
MQKLIAEIKKAEKEIKPLVEKRIKEFSAVCKSGKERIFCEMCFCILTANYSAEGGIKIQNMVDRGFCTYSQKKMARTFKVLGYRFPNTRASYIFSARKHMSSLPSILKSSAHKRKQKDEEQIREWLVKNIKGLGMKEASHFMRNIGFRNVAIIDFHIIDILERHKIIEKPKTLTKGNYLKIEKKLRKLAHKLGLSLAELDLYLWYLETGKVLK